MQRRRSPQPLNGFVKVKFMDLQLLTQAIPITAIICAVYTATRFELREKIISAATVMFLKTLGVLAGIYIFLLWFSS